MTMFEILHNIIENEKIDKTIGLRQYKGPDRY